MFVTPESEGLRMRLPVKSYTERAGGVRLYVPPLMSSLAAGY